MSFVHHFNVQVAEELGVNAAILAANVQFWCAKNEANESKRHFHEEKYWTFNSISALEKLFPYLTIKQIRTALDKCVEDGLLLCGQFNKDKRDRTKWYAYNGLAWSEKKGNAFAPEGKSHLPLRANPFAPEGKPLPDTNPDNKPTSNDVVCAQDAPTPPKAKTKRTPKRGSRISETWAPTQMDYAHATKKGLTPQEINHEADQFRNYHLSKGTVSKDWAASWRTWCGNAAKWKAERSANRRPNHGASESSNPAFNLLDRLHAAPQGGDELGSVQGEDAFVIDHEPMAAGWR